VIFIDGGSEVVIRGDWTWGRRRGK